MSLTALLLAIAFQVTPPPSPPLLTPAPSPAASPTPSSPPSPAPMNAQPAVLNLHPAQAQTISVAGGSGTLSASLDTPVATVTIDQAARTITVSAGQQTGRATLTVTDQSGASIAIPVRVAFDAGSIPATLTLRVTGNPVDAQWLQAQIQNLVTRSIQLQPGLQGAQLGTITPPLNFAPGSTAAVPVTVHIPGGDQYYDVNAAASVTVQNIAADPFLPPLLFYDDDPEKLVDNGVLYRGQINPGSPARLYYYHQNAVDARRLLVVLSSASAQPSTVQLLDASAGPNIDVMSVGHAVTRDFLQIKPRNQGMVVDVASGAPFIADEFTMKPVEGAAGNVGIRVLSGAPVTVTVLAVPATVSDNQIAAYLDGPRLPGDGHHRSGTFSIGDYGTEVVAYSVGGPDAMLQYGAATPPALDPAAGGHDYGEYGVWRTVTFDAQNSGGDPATVYLYERPMGGVVRSSFLVNGTLAQAGCVRLPARYQIGTPLSLPPGRSQVVVQTMTDGGSNYPLEVGLTAAPPTPSPPPITAPEGCFPKPGPVPTPMTSPGPAVPVPEPTGRLK